MLFFIQTTRFYPDKFEKLGFKKNDDGLYVYTKDNSLWRERALLDLGYGREKGLVRIPELSFESLIQLVLVDYNDKICEETYNFWGALSILIDDYSNELINLLSKTIDCNELKLKHKFIYDYLNLEFNLDDNLIKKLKNKNLADCCIKWKKYNKKI